MRLSAKQTRRSPVFMCLSSRKTMGSRIISCEAITLLTDYRWMPFGYPQTAEIRAPRCRTHLAIKHQIYIAEVWTYRWERKTRWPKLADRNRTGPRKLTLYLTRLVMPWLDDPLIRAHFLETSFNWFCLYHFHFIEVERKLLMFKKRLSWFQTKSAMHSVINTCSINLQYRFG